MCFGDKKKTEETTKTTTIDPALAAAATRNTNSLTDLANSGYKEYTGPRVAESTGDSLASYDMVRALAGSSDPYLQTVEGLYKTAGTTPASTVSTTRAIDNVPGQGASGSTQDYMDPYRDAVLRPQLADLDEEAARNQKGTNAMATMAGAFGDSGWGFETARNADLQRRARESAIANANSQAFNTAMALKTGDINRLLDVDKSNAALKEQALARGLAGGQALTSLDQYETGRTASLAGMLDQVGKEQQAVEQAKLDAAYQEYAKGNMSEAEMWALVNNSVNGSPLAKQGTATSETYKPDNTGYGLLAALGGTALNAAMPGVGTALSAGASYGVNDANDPYRVA